MRCDECGRSINDRLDGGGYRLERLGMVSISQSDGWKVCSTACLMQIVHRLPPLIDELAPGEKMSGRRFK